MREEFGAPWVFSRFSGRILPDFLHHLGEIHVMLMKESRRSALHGAWRALVFAAWLCNPAALLVAQVRMEFPDGTEVRPGRLWKAQVVWDGPATRWLSLEFAVGSPAGLGPVSASRARSLPPGIEVTETISQGTPRLALSASGTSISRGQVLVELAWRLAPELSDLSTASVGLEAILLRRLDGLSEPLSTSQHALRVGSASDGSSILTLQTTALSLWGEPGTGHRMEGSEDAVVWSPLEGVQLQWAQGWDRPVSLPMPQVGIGPRRFFRARVEPVEPLVTVLSSLPDPRTVRTRQPFRLGVRLASPTGEPAGAGTVSFWAGTERLGVGLVTNGVCQIDAVMAREGSFPLSVRFSGSARFSPGRLALEPALTVADFLEGDDLTDSKAASFPDKGTGWVCVATNGTDPTIGNELKVFRRSSTGELTLERTLSLGGRGIQVLSDTIPASNALCLSANGRWLFAVNAGTDEISVLRVDVDGPHLLGRFPSGGSLPVSVAVSHNRVFVAHCGGSGSIAGFRLGLDGTLTQIPDSVRSLSNGGQGASTTPATVQFTPDGTRLVVAEADGDALSLFSIAADGKPSEAAVFSVPGTTPTGIAFAKDHFLVVAEAAGDRVGEGTVSSFELLKTGFRPISRSLATTQTATCWVAVDRTGSYAYFANYEDFNLSTFGVGSDGALTLVEARSADLGENGSPTDLAISRDNRWLYVLCDTRNSVIGWGIEANGALKRVGEFGGAPKGSVGMIAW